MLFKGIRVICEENRQFAVKISNHNFVKSGSAYIKDCKIAFDVKENGINIGIDCKEQNYETLKISSRH
jgi:hypothetical protein